MPNCCNVETSAEQYQKKCDFLNNLASLRRIFCFFGVAFDPAPCLFADLKYTNVCFSSDFWSVRKFLRILCVIRLFFSKNAASSVFCAIVGL